MRVPPTSTSRILPPGRGALSNTVTPTPARAKSMAQANPPMPAPMTTTFS
jgi:hypothetical protein